MPHTAVRWTVKLLAIAAIGWPLLLGAVVWHRAVSGEAVWTTVVHLAASRICHQKPERSFRTAGVQWPVCGRCSGLYLGAPIGAIAALGLTRARRRRVLALLAIAAAPTALTLALEWLQLAPVSNLARALTAAPLGAAIALVLGHTAAGDAAAIG